MDMGLDDGMILEGIVRTVGAGGELRISPMGPRVDAEMEIRVRAGTPVQMMGVVRRADYREAPPASASGGSEATGTISGRVSVEMGASLR